MKVVTTILLALVLVACGGKKDATQDFDKYLEMLMSEPYNPNNGSIY